MTAPVDAKAKPGTICRAYVSSTALADTDTATEVLAALAVSDQYVRIDNLLQDAKKTDNRSTAEMKERGRDFGVVFTGGRIVGFSCKITRRKGNTGYDLLANAYKNNTEIAVCLSDGNIATTGTQSFVFMGIITKWDEDQPDPGATTHDFEVRVSGVSAFTPVEVTKS